MKTNFMEESATLWLVEESAKNLMVACDNIDLFECAEDGDSLFLSAEDVADLALAMRAIHEVLQNIQAKVDKGITEMEEAELN